MNNIYHTKCLQLILAISKALDKLDEGNHAAARQILSEAWRDAVGEIPMLSMK